MSRPHGLTEDGIAKMKPERSGKRDDVPDGLTPNLFVRVGARQTTFVMLARFGRRKNTSRRGIGVFGVISLEQARATAAEWNALIKRGIDPWEEEERKAKEEELKDRHTFASVMEDYIAELQYRERNKTVAENIRAIRSDILNPARNTWLDLPISKVRAHHVSKLVKAIRDRPAPAAALTAFRRFKTFFNWLIDPDRQLDYGMDPDNPFNPIRDLKASTLELHGRVRDRVLHKAELRAYLRAAEEMPYPYGPFFKALLLTGVRKAELTGMRWSEIDWADDLWIVPKERFKAGTQHLVPLSGPMIQLLRDIRDRLPAYHGDCVFSTTNGQLPITVGRKMDAFRANVAAAFAEIQPGAAMASFWMHDDRRVVRSNLAALKVREAVIDTIQGHGKKGMKRIYDQYTYLDETAEALALWADWLGRLAAGTAPDAEGGGRTGGAASRRQP
ncbi:tyrosine-type recombinase/integrase [Rhizobium leguminosarum]|uniref:tyrosine-type recombinase/integrase n=1 Tax=Rhizobium leguminosarum TaxID=384 RepID=UPI001C985896|nr:tyrosine-type recombinase/integrase [Rhizobium leguminosarum]MBY5820492.1 tyrosine-type recombinase/integrase [Rhizobium leguminosarum]